MFADAISTPDKSGNRKLIQTGPVCTFMSSNHRVIMHRFHLKTRRQSGQEGTSVHHSIPNALPVQLIHHPKFLITQSAIRNHRKPLKTKDRHAF